MKNVLILGVTGGTGKFVSEMLEDSSNIIQTVYVRNKNKLDKKLKETITVLEGDVLDTANLKVAMNNQDIVVACLNGDLLAQAESIVEASKAMKVTRIIWLTGLGIHHEVPGSVGEMLDKLIKQFPDYVKAADTIANSGKSYTLVRAANLVDGDNINYNLTKEGEMILDESVTRRAVARFIADMILDENGLGENESLGVTNNSEQ